MELDNVMCIMYPAARYHCSLRFNFSRILVLRVVDFVQWRKGGSHDI